MERKTRIWCRILAVVLMLVSLAGGVRCGFKASVASPKSEDYGTSPKVIQVSNLESFTKAVEEITEDADRWQKKYLLIRSEKAFDTRGANRVIQGYDQMYILGYDSEKKTQEAYEYYKTIPQLTVETDQVITSAMESIKAMGADESNRNYIRPEIRQGNSMEWKVPDSRVVVAIIDTGYDLAGDGTTGITDRINIMDALDLTGSGTIQDENGHGTAMANIILEHAGNGVKVMPIKVADKAGRSSSLKLYLAIRHGIEQGADIINISMSSYKPTDKGIVAAAIREAAAQGIFVVTAAGNYGENTADYIPANVEKAIVVSAVNADKTRDTYSNYGNSTDYCAYGSVETKGIHNKKVTISGTSVSAAIVSAVISRIIRLHPGISYDAVLETLDTRAEDLGIVGKDAFYGNGFLTLESIKALEEEKKVVDVPELFACDWRNLSDTKLNEIIDSTTSLNQKRFLDDLSETDRNELLNRKNILYNHQHTAIVYDAELKETARFTGTLRSYLYSKFFDDYVVQKATKNTYSIYNEKQPYWAASCSGSVQVNTSQNQAKATIKFTQSGGQPTDTYTVMIEASNNGAFRFGDMELAGRFLSGDDNGHNLGNTPVPMASFVKGIKVEKPAHATATGQTKSREKTDTRLVTGGFYKPNAATVTDSDYKKYTDHITENYGQNDCGVTLTENVFLMISVFELDCGQVFTMNFKKHGIKEGEWGGWATTQKATCTHTGVETRFRKDVCGNCGAEVKSDSQTRVQNRLTHAFTYTYETNNNIPNGKRWQQCARSETDCGRGNDGNGEPWQKDVQYLQSIRYWEMNTDGSYSASPTGVERNGEYFPAGATVPAWSRTPSKEFLTGEVKAYTTLEKAEYQDVKIPRKQYKVRYDGNGAAGGATATNEKVYCGSVFQLSKNGFEHIGYKFLGWSTTANGKVKYQDGESVSNLTYIHENTITLYAQWEKLYGIQYSGNLTTEEIENIKTDARETDMDSLLSIPATKWKEKGKSMEITFEEAAVLKGVFKDIYRLKGWSLTPEITGEEEIILSREKNHYTFTEDEDVTLYAQWNTGYTVAYVGNEQTEGVDYQEEVSGVKDDYTFSTSDKEQIESMQNTVADYFVKTIEKPTIDIATGEATDENGRPYMETVPYGFQGWSMYSTREQQQKWERYQELGQIKGAALIVEAKKASDEEAGKGLTFGVPVTDYGTFNAPHVHTETEEGEKAEIAVADSTKGAPEDAANKPYVNMYAIWDQYPQILASDLYLPLADAQDGRISEEYLLNLAKAKDEELESDSNPEGQLKNGKDTINNTQFTISDYQASEFLGAEGNMALTITYCAEDSAGNMARKMVTVHLVDTIPKNYDNGSVRFISQKHIDTLAEDSIWRTGEYATLLAEVLGNRKTGEEYTTITPLQQACGAQSVKKPGSGTWEQVSQVWKFTHEEVLAVQEYVKTNGIVETQEAFLQKFAHCRVQ